MKSLNQHRLLPVYLGMLLTLVILFEIGTFIFDPTSLTFQSSADEPARIVSVSESAESSVVLNASDLPSCVSSLNYIPKDETTTCLITFRCASVNELKSLESSCSQNNGVFTCLTDDNQCKTHGDWIEQAGNICGC